MATSSYDSAYRIGATTYAIPAGITVGTGYVPQVEYRMDAQVNWVSGGTLLIIGTDIGVTLAAATLAVSDFYVVPSVTGVNISGPAPFYLAAQGTTSVVSLLFRYSQGASLGV